MRIISLSQAQPGMVIARNVFGADGDLLLAGGMMLTESYIRRLRSLGIYSIYIESLLGENVETPEVLQEKTRTMAVARIQETFKNLRKRQSTSCEAVHKIAATIVEEIMNNKCAMVQLTDIRTFDDYTFGHSVNVCVLAVLTGMALGTMNRERLEKLAMGALLHDVGKMMVPNEIINKPGKLDAGEWKIMQQHSAYGFEILRTKSRDLSIISAHVAFQHHEKFNGEGYPRGLSGDHIHEFARIVAVADVYDALTSDRVYNKAMQLQQAYEILLAEANTHFDPVILQAFLERIAIYPAGCLVELNTGDIGIVVKVIPKLATRPTVRLIVNCDGDRYPDRPEIDLSVEHTIFVRRVLAEAELSEWNTDITSQ